MPVEPSIAGLSRCRCDHTPVPQAGNVSRASAHSRAPRECLTRTAYNLTSFSPTAQQIHDAVIGAFPGAVVQWTTDAKRQSIVDSWPEDVDDSAARRDWGFKPMYDFKTAFDDYLIPNVRERYR